MMRMKRRKRWYIKWLAGQWCDGCKGQSMDLPVGLSHVFHQDEDTMLMMMMMATVMTMKITMTMTMRILGQASE